MSIRKTFGILSMIVWITLVALLIIATETAIPTGKPNTQNSGFAIAEIFAYIFVVMSLFNTPFMVLDLRGPFSSIAGPAIICFGLLIAVMLVMAGLNVNPGSTSQLFKSNVVDYIIVCLVAGAIIDVADLFIVNHKES